MTDKIKEGAAAGSVGAHSVATAPTRMTGIKTRGLKGFLANYPRKFENTLQLFPVNLYKLSKGKDKKVEVVGTVNENFNLDSVFSQLKNFENKNSVEPGEVTTYGIEDDKGNLMKVTVLNTQQEDFEAYIAAYLSTLKDFKNQGIDLQDISLAELLYKLKDIFDIRDVEFPNIPDDIVYNADEASESVEEPSLESDLDPQNYEDNDMDMGMEGDMEGDMDDEEGFMDDEEGFMDDEEGFMDDESVEDFEEMGDETSVQSLLMSVLDMLKTTAEKEKAQAEAEAEKARAEQAEYTAKAAEATLAQKEELIAMKAEKDEQKAREKRAKEQADLATFRYKQSKGMVDEPTTATFEGFNKDSILLRSLVEGVIKLDEEETITDPNMLRRVFMMELNSLRKEYQEEENPQAKAAIQKEITALQRSFTVKKQRLQARAEREKALDSERSEERMDNTRDSQIMENLVVEKISEDDYNTLDEAAKRQFKRYGNKFIRKFRCYGGPKDGRIVSKMSDCGIRKDPLKVRQGKKAARMKKGQRIRKTQLAKKKAPSKRLVRMNKIMRGK